MDERVTISCNSSFCEDICVDCIQKKKKCVKYQGEKQQRKI